MSTLPLSIDTLAQVRETMCSATFWREHTKETPLWFCESFMGPTGYYKHDEKNVREKANEFVHLAWIFNAVAYHRGEFTDFEPIDWGCALHAIDITKQKRIGICQLVKTLQCIEYNTDAKGWMRPEFYNTWPRKEQYEKFHKILHEMIFVLLSHIVSYDAEYSAAKWG